MEEVDFLQEEVDSGVIASRLVGVSVEAGVMGEANSEVRVNTLADRKVPVGVMVRGG